jgi:hypothetical protein
MQALAAGRFQEALQSEIGEEVAHLDGGGFKHVDVEPFVRVEIEHQAIGLVEMIERYAPIVNLDSADLRQPE